MNKTLPFLLAFVLAAVALAGCVQEEAVDEGDDTQTLAVDLPEGTTDVIVEFVAWDHAANETTRVSFSIEDDDGATLAQDSFFVSNETRHEVETSVNGTSRIHVMAEVAEGAADVEIAVTAVVPGEAPRILVREKVIVHEETRTEDRDADPAEPADPGEPADPATPQDGEEPVDGNDTATNETADENATADEEEATG